MKERLLRVQRIKTWSFRNSWRATKVFFNHADKTSLHSSRSQAAGSFQIKTVYSCPVRNFLYSYIVSTCGLSFWRTNCIYPICKKWIQIFYSKQSTWGTAVNKSIAYRNFIGSNSDTLVCQSFSLHYNQMGVVFHTEFRSCFLTKMKSSFSVKKWTPFYRTVSKKSSEHSSSCYSKLHF